MAGVKHELDADEDPLTAACVRIVELEAEVASLKAQLAASACMRGLCQCCVVDDDYYDDSSFLLFYSVII